MTRWRILPGSVIVQIAVRANLAVGCSGGVGHGMLRPNHCVMLPEHHNLSTGTWSIGAFDGPPAARAY